MWSRRFLYRITNTAAVATASTIPSGVSSGTVGDACGSFVDWVGVASGVGELVWAGVEVGDGVGVNVVVGVGVGVGVAVGPGVEVGAWVGLDVGTGVGVGVGAALTVTESAVELVAAPALSVVWRMKFQSPGVVDVEGTKL